MKSFSIMLLLLVSACSANSIPTARLTINNTTDLRTLPQLPISIWSVYVTPTNSQTPALDRSADLLASSALKPGASQTFSINSCGQLLDVLVIFSDGTEQAFSSTSIVECGTGYSEDVL